MTDTPPHVAAAGRRPLLMLVDDQPRNSRLLQAQLGNEQFDFLIAESGEEALSQLESTLPDQIGRASCRERV